MAQGAAERTIVRTRRVQSSGRLDDPAAARALLIEARSAMEGLKAAELREYFQDECVAALEAQARPVDEVAPSAAVVYPISLPDRLELLVSRSSGISRRMRPRCSWRSRRASTVVRAG